MLFVISAALAHCNDLLNSFQPFGNNEGIPLFSPVRRPGNLFCFGVVCKLLLHERNGS